MAVTYDDVRKLLKCQLGWKTIGEITILNDTLNNRDALTFAVAGPQPVIVRIGDVTQEVMSYRSLKTVLPHRIPRIISTDFRSFLIRNSIEGLDLCSYVAHHKPDRSCAMFEKILNETASVWQHTNQNKSSDTPRFEGMLERISHYRELIQQNVLPLDRFLVVNGTSCPPLQEVFEELESYYRRTPNLIHLTFGDPWPGNIIVTNCDEFYFIDCHGRSSDWVEDLVRLGQWRKFYLLQTLDLKKRQVDSRIELNFSCQFPEPIAQFEAMAMAIGKQFAKSINDHRWLERFSLISCLAYLRDAARLKNDARWQRKPEHHFMEICFALEYFNQFDSLAR